VATRRAGTAVREHGERARQRVTETTVTEDLSDDDRNRANADRLSESQDDRDRSVMDGGPGQGSDAPAPQFSFSYGGKEFKTQEEITQYIDDLQTQRDANKQPAVREEVREAPAKQEERKRAGDSIDFDKELYTDPKKVFSQFRDEIRAEIKQEMQQEYQADQTIRTFWREFYNENTDMKGKEMLVNAVFNASLKDIGDLPIGKAKEELGKRVRDEVFKITGEKPRQDGKSSAKNRTLVEAGSGPATRGNATRESGQNAETPNIPNSLSALIRSRQAARRGQPQQKAN